jgi:hypothetical protein
MRGPPVFLFFLLANRVISYPNCLLLITSITQYSIRYPRSLLRLSCTQLLIVLAPETFTRPRHKSTYPFFHFSAFLANIFHSLVNLSKKER